jgi:hypothetical protein
MCVFHNLPNHKSSREQQYEAKEQIAENGQRVLPVCSRALLAVVTHITIPNLPLPPASRQRKRDFLS